jgi:hypothetical protein
MRSNGKLDGKRSNGRRSGGERDNGNRSNITYMALELERLSVCVAGVHNGVCVAPAVCSKWKIRQLWARTPRSIRSIRPSTSRPFYSRPMHQIYCIAKNSMCKALLTDLSRGIRCATIRLFSHSILVLGFNAAGVGASYIDVLQKEGRQSDTNVIRETTERQDDGARDVDRR